MGLDLLWSCSLFIVVEVESALRHKAKLERHQRIAERAVYSNAIAMLPSTCLFAWPVAVLIITNFQAKALAEKNMQDILVQREHAEKHVR